MNTIGITSDDTLKLQAFLEAQPAGVVLSYADLQSQTGIRMDLVGKARLRQALRSIRREYSCVRGYGIALANTESVMPILSTRIRRIDKAVKRADRTQRILQEQFYATLSDDDKKRILFAGAMFGAIRLAADQGKKMYIGKPMIEATTHIPIPQL